MSISGCRAQLGSTEDDGSEDLLDEMKDDVQPPSPVDSTNGIGGNVATWLRAAWWTFFAVVRARSPFFKSTTGLVHLIRRVGNVPSEL